MRTSENYYAQVRPIRIPCIRSMCILSHTIVCNQRNCCNTLGLYLQHGGR